MEIRALKNILDGILGQRPSQGQEIIPRDSSLREELAKTQLARYYTNEEILTSAYRATRAFTAAKAKTAEFRRLPDAWRAENILTFLEGSNRSAMSEAAASARMVREGILYNIPQHKRAEVEREGLTLAQQILREKLGREGSVDEEYRLAALEMLSLLGNRLGQTDQHNTPSSSIKLPAKK